ncbi:MAG: tetratricopeptide repeat protein [Phycisphaerae bacterium]|nr:tetratricopeptide repeat protein [Phycisphaerae bacterium]
MNTQRSKRRWHTGGPGLVLLAIASLSGCGHELSYGELRQLGQEKMIRHEYGAARNLLLEARERVPEDPWNLYDLGDCNIYLAKAQFHLRDAPAAMRYVDDAVRSYARAVNAHPGMQPALWGKNMALELKRQFEAALAVAKWTAEFVGPSARGQIFLAHELEERNDPDAALLRYRQAVAMEPHNAYANAELGRFYARIRRRTEAVRLLRTAYALNPSEPGVLEALRELGETP